MRRRHHWATPHVGLHLKPQIHGKGHSLKTFVHVTVKSDSSYLLQDRQASNASFQEHAMADSQVAPTSARQPDDYWAAPTQDRLLLVEGGDQCGEADRP